MSNQSNQIILTDAPKIMVDNLKKAFLEANDDLKIYSILENERKFEELKKLYTNYFIIEFEYEVKKNQADVLENGYDNLITSKKKNINLEKYRENLSNIKKNICCKFEEEIKKIGRIPQYNTTILVSIEEVQKEVDNFLTNDEMQKLIKSSEDFQLPTDKDEAVIQYKKFLDEVYLLKYKHTKKQNEINVKIESFKIFQMGLEGAKLEYIESVNKLVKEDETDEVYKTIINESLETLKAQIKDKKINVLKNHPRALHFACKHGKFDIVKHLIEVVKFNQEKEIVQNGDPSYYPIHYACFKENENTVNILDYLLLKKANVDSKGMFDRRPIHSATIYGNLKAVKWLISKKADINCVETGTFQTNSPIHNAALQGSVEIIDILIKQGANPVVKNKRDKTPLMYAIEEEKYDVANYFWNMGIWLSSQDYNELTRINLTEGQLGCIETPLRNALKIIDFKNKNQ